ncbi:MAG: helix-turn-helix transcriptional regulator [Bacteroidota bacterium]
MAIHKTNFSFDDKSMNLVVQLKDNVMPLVTDLTNREIEIIDALSKGLSSDEISAKLFISVFTVNTHRRNAMIKANARSAAHLVRRCFEEGVIKHRKEYAFHWDT